MPVDVYLNVAVGGILTGLVYGLMALGLSVIFGVVRVVNFAHGEMMTIAMYIAVVLFSAFHLDPLLMLVPIAITLFAFGYVLQAGLINLFITRPEHSQFLLLVAIALIIVNVLLILFGPDAQNVQVAYAFDSFQIGRLIIDATKLYAGIAAIVVASGLFAFFRYTLIGTAIRACADNYTGAQVVGLDVKRLYALTFGLGRGLRRRRRHDPAADLRRHPGAGPGLYAARLRHRHHRRAGLDAGRAHRRRADRADRGDGRPAVHAVGQKHVRLRHSGAGAAVPPAGHHGQGRGMTLLDGVPRRALWLIGALLALLVAAPLFAGDYLLTVLILMLYFAYIGQAWNIMMGFAGQLSLGHALYVGLGAYTAAALYVHFGVGPWLGLIVAAPLAALAGAFVGFLAFRFRVAGVYFAILTIAVAEFARVGFDHLGWTGGSAGLFLPVAQYAHNDLWDLRGHPVMFYYILLAATCLAFVACRALLQSRIGYFWRAIREDEEAARASGIDTFHYKMVAVVISAGMTSFAGVIYAFYYNNLFPEQVFGIGRSIEIILGPIVGGVGTLFGPVLGAFVLTGLAESLNGALAAIGVDVPGAKQVFYGICLLVVILALPDGIWPWLSRHLGLTERKP